MFLKKIDSKGEKKILRLIFRHNEDLNQKYNTVNVLGLL
jgi:hypothetical protein